MDTSTQSMDMQTEGSNNNNNNDNRNKKLMMGGCGVVLLLVIGGIIIGVVASSGGSSSPTPGPSPTPPGPGPTPPGPPVWNWTKGHPKCLFDDPSGKSCTQPKTAKEMADSLTTTFFDFDPESPEGKQLGVYMTMQTNSLHLYCGTPCYQGHADCILSVAIYNSHMMLDGDQQGAHINVFAMMTAGYIINREKMESRYAKCAFMFDGAINSRLYWGCGDVGPGGADCKNVQSAYLNNCKKKDGSFGICEPDDEQVRLRNDCTMALNQSNPYHRIDGFPYRTDQAPCYYTGPAFRYPDYSRAKEDNLLREMVTARIKNEDPVPGSCKDEKDKCKRPGGGYYEPVGPDGYCCKPWKDGHPQDDSCAGIKKIHQTNCNRMGKWNEIAVDLRPFMDDLKHDPNTVISAFVYADPSAKSVAERLRKEFKDTYGGVGDVPLVYLDLGQNVIKSLKKFGSPFKENPSSEDEEQAMSV